MENLYDNLAVKIYSNRALMGAAAASEVAERIAALHKQQGYANIIFASAPSQNEFLTGLVENTEIDWHRVNAFHMDEYIELPEDDPATFRSFLNKKIFQNLDFNSVNYINGNAPSIGEECRRYGALLTAFPPDIVCLGIGENGHLAFNDPHVADFNDPLLVKMVKLDADSRKQQVSDECFSNLADVPGYAITLTIPTLMAAAYIYCIVPGPQKATAVYNTLHQQIIEKYPSTILRRHPNAKLILDKASSSLL
jgi:glucosamine-6-phosphate deaminase